MATDAELVELQQTLYTSRNPTRRWLHVTRRARIRELVYRHLPDKCGRALEVGPGSGVYLPLLAAMFNEVVASDVEPAYLRHAHALTAVHDNLALEVDDITATRLPAGSFDLVLCSEVIEHIANSQAALVNMARLLAPGGVLVLSTPQRYSTLEVACRVAFWPGFLQLARRVYRESILPTGHLNLLTRDNVRAQLRSAGLTVVAADLSGIYLPFVAEFGGRPGLRLAQRIERPLSNSRFRGALWTQYYVARSAEAMVESRSPISGNHSAPCELAR
jgi:2-polyprenyl-3-methyl-5-hydroxy-6-metoxy-1,4-benzoquinol methylase